MIKLDMKRGSRYKRDLMENKSEKQATINISLPVTLRGFVTQYVKDEKYTSISEFIRELIRERYRKLYGGVTGRGGEELSALAGILPKGDINLVRIQAGILAREETVPFTQALKHLVERLLNGFEITTSGAIKKTIQIEWDNLSERETS